MAKHPSAEHLETDAPQQAEYASALFTQFCRHISELGPDAAILDLGPSTTGNIMFWISLGHRVSALDLVSHPSKERINLDYPDGSFGGILCWTAFSHLPAQGARDLMQEVGRVLHTDGWLFSIFDGDGRKDPPAQRYRILDPERLGFEPLVGGARPRAVLTREVEVLYQPFREVRVMVMRHGSREALGRKP